ncbi:MAG TPA: hypothetical protein PK156_50405, partial [Polyangium sp.]|nr:hypothetical protein [Polyangium sp.]
NDVWPRLDFIPVGEKPGRGKERKLLTKWRYELQQLPLLAAISARTATDAVAVVIDANIFFDLDPEGNGREESRALEEEDWLEDHIELWLTDEIYNEIKRRSAEADRKRQRARADGVKKVRSPEQRMTDVFARLQAMFPDWTTENDKSDLRHVAKTIAADVTFFVTRDGEILDIADKIAEQFELEIVSPHEIILKFDQLRRNAEYRPRRLVGLDLVESKVLGEGASARIADLIHEGHSAPEPRNQTEARLRDLMACPGRVEFVCIRARDGELIAAYAIERVNDDIARLRLFAVAASDLGRTAARHFAHQIVVRVSGEGRKVIIAKDLVGGARASEALSEAGFFEQDARWVKLALPMVADATDAVREIERIGAAYPECHSTAQNIATTLRVLREGSDVQPHLHVERALWPLKLNGTGLRCFIVPIRPHWAQQLFDTELPQQGLFQNSLLTLRPENAYYRSAKSRILTAPARVLWYVSTNKAGAKALRANSYVDEVVVDGPKEVFRRFRRLGVYSWDDVRNTAAKDPSNQVMGFQFSKTELFRNPVEWPLLQETLLKHLGKNNPLVGPVEVPEDCFLELYRLGMYGA